MRYVTPAPGDGEVIPFGKPKDWDDATHGPCGTLPVRRQVEGVGGGRAYIGLYSNWKPDDKELARLNAGHVVELCCCGIQPAVSVSVVPCADPKAASPARSITAIFGAVARGWCQEPNTKKELDVDLAGAIVREVATLFGVPQDA